MKKLALYPDGLPPAAVNVTEARTYDPECSLCPCWEGVRKVCMPAEVKGKGGVLIVGERPSRLEDTAGKVFYGQSSLRVRTMLDKHWKGAIAYDYALRCTTNAEKIKDKFLDACRTYTARTLKKAKPQRIICMGSEASYSVLGRRISSAHVRRAYGWIHGPDGGDPIPVFILPHAKFAFSNPFSAKAFEEDLKWALTASYLPWFTSAVTMLVENEEDAVKAYKRIKGREWFTYDVETYGLMHNKNFRVESGTFLGSNSTRSYTWTRNAMKDPGARTWLKKLLRSSKLKAVTQNGKYDDRSMLCEVGVAPDVLYDTRLGRKLLEPTALASLELLAETVGMGGHKHEADTALKLAERELNRLAFPLAAFTPKGKARKPPAPPKFAVESRTLKEIQAGVDPRAYAFAYLPDRTLYRYNARDVWSTREVAIQDMHTLTEHPTISRAWKLIVRDANKAVRKIEHWGFPVDKAAVKNLASYCEQGVSELEAKMKKYTDINAGSPKQLAEFLYDELGLACGKQTKTGARSTDEEALEGLRKKHPYVDLLLEHRKLKKFGGTYGTGMLQHIRDDGRIHSSFLIDGTETGRLSSREPNLQNIPRAKGSLLGTMARNCFVSGGADWELLELDFSQLELRIAAMLSGDDEMIKDFKAGIDIHMNGATACCEVVWGIKPEKWATMDKDARDPYRSQIKCFHPDTEVLTRTGWKRMPDLAQGEEVAQAIPGLDGAVTLEWVVPTENFTAHHPSEKMVHLKSRTIDLRVTPDHRMLVWPGFSEHAVVMPNDFNNARQWAGAGVMLGGLDVNLDHLRLAVAIQADGSIRDNGGVVFGFSKERKKHRLIELLDRAGLAYTRSDYEKNVTHFRLRRADVAPVLALLNGKKMPWTWLDLSLEARRVIVDEAALWDSHVQPSGRTYDYSSIHKQNRDVLQAIASTVGRKSKAYKAHLLIKDRAVSRSGSVKIKEEIYKDLVACIAVPSTFVLVRSNGITTVCGQTTIFGKLYGKTDSGLAAEFGCHISVISKINRLIWGRYRKLEAFMEQCKRDARKSGTAWTWWDGGKSRVRPIPAILDPEKTRREHAERTAGNTPVQGTAGDFCTASLWPIIQWIELNGIRAELVSTVHDAVIFNVHKSYTADVRNNADKIMTGHNSLGVPLKTDAKRGPAWGAMVDYKE